MQDDPALDLGVVLGHVRREHLHRSAVHHDHAGCRVGRASPGEPRHFPGEQGDADPSEERNRRPGRFAEEARTDDDVGLARPHRREQQHQPARIVLPIRVDPKHVVVAHAARELETGLDGGADSQVERMTDHECPRPGRCSGGLVPRAIVDDQDIRVGDRPLSATDDVANAKVLVEGGNDHEKRGPPTR